MDSNKIKLTIKRANKTTISAYTRSGRIIDPWYEAKYLIIPETGYVIQSNNPVIELSDFILDNLYKGKTIKITIHLIERRRK